MAGLTHILNPVKVNPPHDLAVAQPITFASMRAAADALPPQQRPQMLALAYAEDREIVPDFFTTVPLPERSIKTVLGLQTGAKLPLLADILQTAYTASTGEYLIYTNTDIAVQPQFYRFVYQELAKGYDCLIINRRRIPYGDFTPADLPNLYPIKGKPHPGFDCFVFRRELVPQMVLGNICIGIPFVEATLAHNLWALAERPKLYDKEFLTFHLGMEIFKKRNKTLYWHNRHEFFRRIKPALWRRFDIRKFPYYAYGFPMRYIKWGLNPALFTLMNLKLDVRRLFKGH